MPLSLNCSWSSYMDWDGLNPEDKKRIKEIGFDAWLDEIVKPKINLGTKFVTGITANQLITSPAVTQRIMPPVVVKNTPQKLGEKGELLAQEFLRIAKENNGVVSLDQATKIHAKAPSDLAYYARLRGHEIKTEKKRMGKTTWVLVKEKTS